MNDSISRQAAIDIADDIRACISVEGYWAFTERLKRLPSAQERKKGEWEVAIGYDHNKKVMCTNCQLMSYEPTPFCPHCGADMRGEEDAKEKF